MTALHEPKATPSRATRKRRIAVISAHTSPLASLGGRETGGMNVYVRELSRELGARGYVIDVFTRRTSDEAPEVQPIGPNARVIHLTAGPSATIEKSDIGAHLDEFEANLLAFVAREREPERQPEGASYDVVHSHYWMSGVVASHLAAKWGVPHAAMFHTLGEVKNRARASEHESATRIDAERMIATTADRIVVASQHEKHLLTALYGARGDAISVVPCGVDLDLFAPMDKEFARRRLGIAHTQRIILFVGRIEPLKGIDILISAAAQLHDDENFAVLIVGGDARAQTQVEELRRHAVGLGIDHHITFVGSVPHEALPLYYNAADVCVVPSYYESFGLVAVEAMACGTPVVASRVGGLTSTVSDGETGYLVPWRCPEPFAERLELLLDNDELRASFGRAGREAVERFRWANVADAVASLYEELLAASHA
jgi:D-inositol-3-phosphate glycosyltransferase